MKAVEARNLAIQNGDDILKPIFIKIKEAASLGKLFLSFDKDEMTDDILLQLINRDYNVSPRFHTGSKAKNVTVSWE